jgi:hypothetical protein
MVIFSVYKQGKIGKKRGKHDIEVLKCLPLTSEGN